MTEALFWVAITPILLFPILYATVAPWWRTEAGRHEMVLGLALFGLALFGLSQRVFGSEYPGEDAVRLVMYVLVSVAVWWRLVRLIRVQIHARWKEES